MDEHYQKVTLLCVDFPSDFHKEALKYIRDISGVPPCARVPSLAIARARTHARTHTLRRRCLTTLTLGLLPFPTVVTLHTHTLARVHHGCIHVRCSHPNQEVPARAPHI